MSRVGSQPVRIPDGVKVRIEPGRVEVEGPKGRLERPILPGIGLRHDAASNCLRVERGEDSPQARCNHGTFRAHLANMVQGVTRGFEKRLRISGVGYGARMEGRTLVMTLGFSHPVRMEVPSDLQVETPSADLVVVRGIDRQRVGQFAADVRAKRPVEPYNLKGIKYEDEVVKKKAGKTFVSGA